MHGRKTAAWSMGIGVSNWGGMSVNGSCLIPSVLYRSIASGTRSVSKLYRLFTNKVVKSLGKSSDSCKHDLSLSASAVMSGTC